MPKMLGITWPVPRLFGGKIIGAPDRLVRYKVV